MSYRILTIDPGSTSTKIGVFDDESEVGHFADELGDARRSDAEECADVAHARGAGILPIRFVDMPDGVDHVDIARFHTFRQCRHQFGDGLGLPADIQEAPHLIHRKQAGLGIGSGIAHRWPNLQLVTNSHYHK